MGERIGSRPAGEGQARHNAMEHRCPDERKGLRPLGIHINGAKGPYMSERSAQQLKRIVPLLQVGSLVDTLTYYQQVLGFALDWAWPQEGEPKWAQVSRGAISFMLTIDLGTSSSPFIAEKGNGVVFYILVDDVEAIYAELVDRGAIIVQELHDFGGRKQFSVADLNGYVFAFSQEFT